MSHAAVKTFDRRGVSCKNAQTVQFSGGVKKMSSDSEDCSAVGERPHSIILASCKPGRRLA